MNKLKAVKWGLIKKLNAKTINKMMKITIVIDIIPLIILSILSYLFRASPDFDLHIYFYSLILLTLFAIDGIFFWLLYHIDDKLKILNNEQRKEIEISLETIINFMHKERRKSNE